MSHSKKFRKIIRSGGSWWKERVISRVNNRKWSRTGENSGLNFF